MRRPTMCVLLLAWGWFCGCGGSPPPESPFPAAPKGGNLIQVPGSGVVVELKTDKAGPSSRGRKEPGKSRIIAYFYESASATSLAPAPSDVTVKLTNTGNGSAVNLAAQSNEPGQFASEPGDYPDALRGQISFQHDGKPYEAKFSFR